MLAIASGKLRRRLPAVQLLTGYGDHLPVADRTFDVVVSTVTFHHLTDSAKRSTLVEVRRVLRPAGRFFLIDFGGPPHWRRRCCSRWAASSTAERTCEPTWR